ncbi:MAG: reductive dehalogenase [bacterium]|nr:reductive dehalogenase [bacterium]
MCVRTTAEECSSAASPGGLKRSAPTWRDTREVFSTSFESVAGRVVPPILRFVYHPVRFSHRVNGRRGRMTPDMDMAISALGWFGLAALALAAVTFAGTSVLERRWRAMGLAALGSVPPLVVGTCVLIGEHPLKPWLVLAGLVVAVLGALLIALPLSRPSSLRVHGPQLRVDERDAIFHRFYRLEPGTPEFEEYYADHPERRNLDERIRALPHLGHPGTRAYHPLASPFQVAASEVLTEATRNIDRLHQPLGAQPVRTTAEEATRRIKGFSRYLGADLVGTTLLNPAHVYSHVGRSPGRWGEPIDLEHTHAVAIGVEMAYDMVRHAPGAATTTETAFRYFEAARVAMLVARYINRLGYRARAHVDGNYRVLCVPVAADAGLGELGRLGLLIHPRFGPRLRLAVVTTDLPLVQDKPVCFGVQHFCDSCRKCATCCPSGAIDSGEREIHNGVEKWRTRQESCYHLWRVQGTDCAICVRVCPYSHPSTLPHNVVRWATRRSPLARRLASWADDLFYGRRPPAHTRLPDWHAEDRAPGPRP